MLASIFLYVVQLVLLFFSSFSILIIGRFNITPIVFVLAWIVGLVATINLYHFNPQVAALLGAIEMFLFGVYMLLIIIKEINSWFK